MDAFTSDFKMEKPLSTETAIINGLNQVIVWTYGICVKINTFCVCNHCYKEYNQAATWLLYKQE